MKVSGDALVDCRTLKALFALPGEVGVHLQYGRFVREDGQPVGLILRAGLRLCRECPVLYRSIRKVPSHIKLVQLPQENRQGTTVSDDVVHIQKDCIAAIANSEQGCGLQIKGADESGEVITGQFFFFNKK